MAFDVHAQLLEQLHTLLQQRVARGWDSWPMTQMELSRRSGVPQPNLSAIMSGKPALEATWNKLFDAALAPPEVMMATEADEAEVLARYGKTCEELADEAEAGYDPAKLVPHHRTPPPDMVPTEERKLEQD